MQVDNPAHSIQNKATHHYQYTNTNNIVQNAMANFHAYVIGLFVAFY